MKAAILVITLMVAFLEPYFLTLLVFTPCSRTLVEILKIK